MSSFFAFSCEHSRLGAAGFGRTNRVIACLHPEKYVKDLIDFKSDYV